MTLREAIAIRCSTRAFAGERPSHSFLAELCKDSELLAPIDIDSLGGGRVGTYGIIQGRPAYVAVSAADRLQAGIDGERLVLELTRQGYDTCWLGASYDGRLVERATSWDATDTIAVIAVGKRAKRRSMIERVMSAAVGARKRKPLDQLILSGSPSGEIAEALEAARLAPSACNRQPWRFVVHPSGEIDVFGTPSDSFMLLDVGIAIAHIFAVCPDYKLSPCTARFPNLTPIATLISSK